MAAVLTLAALFAPARALAAKDNPLSSCDNLAQNGANDCYVWTPPVTAAALVVDGLDTLGEWTGVPAKTLAGGSSGSHTIQARHVRTGTSDSLYFLVTGVDGSFSADDSLQIYFDPLHDDGPPSASSAENVQFKLFRGNDAAAHAPRRITGATDIPWVPVSGQFAVTSSASGWAVEIRVDAAELGVAHLPSVGGFGVLLNDFDTGDTAVWPLNFAPATLFTTWAAFKNRLPIDYVISLDYSGSMVALDGLPSNRWKRAVAAADMFVAVAGLFREPDYYDDRVGGSRYAWDCSVDATAGDRTEMFPEIEGGLTLDAFPPSGTNLFSPQVAPDPLGSNCTPINRGLHFALAQFSPSTFAPEREKLVLLLSDGFHNMPSGDVPFVPSTFFTANERATHKVRTVSMGPDMTAGTALLAQIASAFDSTGLFEAKYNQLAAAQNLLDAYLETLQQPLHVNRVNDDAPATSDGSFQPGTVDRIVFIGAWNTPGAAKPLDIQRDGAAVAGTAIGPDTTIGFSALTIDNPPSGGTWKFGGPVGDRPNQRYVLVDLRVYAEFFTETKVYDTGDPILLQVRLRDRGKPLTTAVATVEVATPGQGLGNVLATTADNCETSPPRIPQLTIGKPPFAAAGTRAVTGAPGATAAAAATPDPIPGRYAIARALLDRCQLRDEKQELPGAPLFDDGSHGDLVSGDGVYSLEVATPREGSYNFRFHVRGADGDGVPFSRTSLLSQYVQVAPTPAATQVVHQLGQVVGGLQTAHVSFIPKDNLGNYVGPGFSSNYRVSVAGGTLLGSLLDLGRGVYTQQIAYPPGREPTVVIESLEPRVRIDPGASPPVPPCPDRDCRHWIWAVVLLAVLLLASIILCIWRWRGRQ